MGQKDLTQKSLESYPDVFADCVNALLYQGNLHLQAENLMPAPTESTYPDSTDELHNQFQDVSKYEMQNGRIRTQYTIENQSAPDKKIEGKNYIPTDQKIIHVEALLRTLRALSNDYRFDEILEQLVDTNEREEITMCELLDKYWNGGVAEGKAESIHNVRSMYNHKLPAETIAELINQSLEYINRIINLFAQYPEEDDISIAKRLLAE